MKRTIQREEELTEIAEDILASISKKATAQVIALTGDLGAGKTALTKALARALGITEHITSPTFVIMKSYEVSGHSFIRTLTHIDAYRIDDIDEMRVLGFKEILSDPTGLVCLEWPERIEELIPEDALRVDITIGVGGERTITYGE